jgi:sensor histidine kinase YesM
MSNKKIVDDLEESVKWFNKQWPVVTINSIWLSLVGLFLTSFLFKENIELQTMNNWISLVLGLIATLLSIISLILSFYNLEKGNELNEKNIKVLRELQGSIEKKLEKIESLQNKTNDAVEGWLNQRPKSESVSSSEDDWVREKDSDWGLW